MNDALKWIFKILLQAVLWVFIFSIRLDGRPIFAYASEILVQNALVRAADEELADLWYRVSRTATATFSRTAPDERKAM